MKETAQTPGQAARALRDGIAAGQFYVLAPDRSLPREMMHAQIRVRTDDIVLGRPPLSHTLRGDPLGTEVRGQIKKGMQQGLARQKATGKL